MKKQPKNRFDPQRNQKVKGNSAMASLSQSTPDTPLQVGKAQAAPNLDQSKVDYGTTQFGRGANQVGDNPSAQLANAIQTLQQTAVSVVDTAHRFQEYKDSEVDAARREELQAWTLANPNADETTKIQQAAVINGRYKDQYGLTTSKRALDVENFKLSASLPGAKYQDFERDYVYQRGVILTSTEMEPEEKAKRLKELNDTFLETGLNQFGDNEEYASAIYRTVIEGRNENQERITRTVRKNLRVMEPRINEVIEEVITEIGEGDHAPMNRAELAKLVSERAGVPEEMQSELFLEQFNMFYREKIDQHYKNVDLAFKRRVAEANAGELAMTTAALQNSEELDPTLTGDAYAAAAANVVDGGADQRRKAYEQAVTLMANQYATKYLKGRGFAKDAWESEAKAVAEQFGLDPAGPLVEAALNSAKDGLGPLGFSAAERAMVNRDTKTMIEIGLEADDEKERWAAQVLSTEDIFSAVVSQSINKGVEYLARQPHFRDMTSTQLNIISTEAGGALMRARLSHSRNPEGKQFADHLFRELEGKSDDVRNAVAIMGSADPAGEAFLDDMTDDLRRLRDGEVLHVDRFRQTRDRSIGLNIVPNAQGQLEYDGDPAQEAANRKALYSDGTSWADQNREEVPDFNEFFQVQAGDVETLAGLLLSDAGFMGHLVSEEESAENRAVYLLGRMSEAMGRGNGFDVNQNSPEMLQAISFVRDEIFNSGLLTQIQEAQNATPPNTQRVGELVNELNSKSEGAWIGLARLSTNRKIKGSSTGALLHQVGAPVETHGIGGKEKSDTNFFKAMRAQKNDPSIQEFVAMYPGLETAADIVSKARAQGFVLVMDKSGTRETPRLERSPSLTKEQAPIVNVSGLVGSGGRGYKINQHAQEDIRNELNALTAMVGDNPDEHPMLVKLIDFYRVLAEGNGTATTLKDSHNEIFTMARRRTQPGDAGETVHLIDGPHLATLQAVLQDKAYYKKLRETYKTDEEIGKAIHLISQNTRLVDGRYVAVVPVGTGGIEMPGADKEFTLNGLGQNYAEGISGPWRPSYNPPPPPRGGSDRSRDVTISDSLHDIEPGLLSGGDLSREAPDANYFEEGELTFGKSRKDEPRRPANPSVRVNLDELREEYNQQYQD